MKKNNFINESDTKPKKEKKKKKKKEHIFGYADVYHQSKSQSNEVKYRYVGTKYDNDSNSLDSFDFDAHNFGGNTQQIDYKRHTKTIGYGFIIDRKTGNIVDGYWGVLSAQNTIKLQFNKEEDKVIGVYGYNKKSKKITDIDDFDMTKNPDWIVLGDTEYLVYQNGDVFEGKCKFSNKYNCYIPVKSDKKGIMYRKNGDREIGDFTNKGKLISGKKISWEGVVTMVEKEEKDKETQDNKTKEKKSATSMLDKPNTSKEQIDNSNSKMTTIKFANNSNGKNDNNDINRKIDENKEKLKKVERVASDVKQSKKLNSEKEALIGFQVNAGDFN